MCTQSRALVSGVAKPISRAKGTQTVSHGLGRPSFRRRIRYRHPGHGSKQHPPPEASCTGGCVSLDGDCIETRGLKTPWLATTSLNDALPPCNAETLVTSDVSLVHSQVEFLHHCRQNDYVSLSMRHNGWPMNERICCLPVGSRCCTLRYLIWTANFSSWRSLGLYCALTPRGLPVVAPCLMC